MSSGTGPEAAACRQGQSGLGRIDGLLSEVEETFDLVQPLLRTGTVRPQPQPRRSSRSGGET
jgi:hypothetical protein